MRIKSGNREYEFEKLVIKGYDENAKTLEFFYKCSVYNMRTITYLHHGDLVLYDVVKPKLRTEVCKSCKLYSACEVYVNRGTLVDRVFMRAINTTNCPNPTIADMARRSFEGVEYVDV